MLATNLGVTLQPGAALIKATTLAEGVNFTNLITNSTTTVPGATFLVTNTIPTAVVYVTNGGTNTITSTNLDVAPPANYSFYYYTNYETYLVQASGATPVIVGTNVQYFLNPGPGFQPANFVPVSHPNDNAGGSASATDDAVNLLNNVVPIDDQNVYQGNADGDTYYNGLLTNFFLTQTLTNLNYTISYNNTGVGSGAGPIFAGTVTTNLQISGTIENSGDSDSLTVGPNAGVVGAAANPVITVLGSGNATAVTATVTNKLPFSSWNATFNVGGTATTGGTLTNTVRTNIYTYVSNGFTNISTNLYTNFTVLNPTCNYVVTGTVKQTFLKIGPP